MRADQPPQFLVASSEPYAKAMNEERPHTEKAVAVTPPRVLLSVLV